MVARIVEHVFRLGQTLTVEPDQGRGDLLGRMCGGVVHDDDGLVAVEGGIAWLPHLMWRMDKNYKALRAQTPWLKKLPSEYIRNHLYVTTQPIEETEKPEQLQQIFEMIGAPHMILFSSDYPHWDFDDPRTAIPSFIPEAKRAAIYGGNARKLGRKEEALGWYEQSFAKSEGPATRLQWGASYVGALVELEEVDIKIYNKNN